jgi:asparagine synthetase B (glutamine-hydrolysing)
VHGQHELVSLAFQLPTELKFDRARGKIALYDLVERRFGPELFRRTKRGFGLPAPYFRAAGLDYLRDLATSRSFRERGLLDPKGVEQVLAAYESGGDLSGDSVWMLGMLELWARAFIDRRAEVAPAGGAEVYGGGPTGSASV